MKERVDCFLGDYAGYTDAPVERAVELIQDLLAENQALTENLASMQETNRALVRRLQKTKMALWDAKNVLADYAGKGVKSDELYSKTEGVIPAGHASRAYLRALEALRQMEKEV